MKIRLTGKKGAVSDPALTWAARGIYWRMSGGGIWGEADEDSLNTMSSDPTSSEIRLAMFCLVDEGYAELVA